MNQNIMHTLSSNYILLTLTDLATYAKMSANLYEKRKLYVIGSFAERFRRETRLRIDSTPVAPNFVEKMIYS